MAEEAAADAVSDCPEEFACPKGHCRGNPSCPNSRITPTRYPKLFEVLRRVR